MLLRIDQAMLMAMRGKAEVGLYSSATELAYKFEMIVISFQTALIPGLVATWKEGSEAYSDLLGKAMRFMLILSLPIAAGTGFIASDIIKFIFKEQYLPAAYVLTVLMWFVPFQFINRILGVSLAARGMEKWVSVGVTIAVLANVGLNLLMIPRYGFEGAGYATVVTEVLLMMIYLFLQRDHFVEIVKNLKIGRVVVALGVMVLGCYLLRNQHALIIIASGGVTYSIFVFASGCIDRKELRAITGK
jgi:O-antigen/teichoic acid export membrane protein